MKVRARINNYRSSARKIRLISPVIKGLGAIDAQVQLEQLRKGCADDVKKLIASAVANAENNHGMNKDSLVVSEFIVEEGKTMKRWMPRAHGRAAQILKRTCNIILALEEKKEENVESAGKKQDKKQPRKGKESKNANVTKEEKPEEKKAVKDNK